MLDAYWQDLVQLALVCSGCAWYENLFFFSFSFFFFFSKKKNTKKYYVGQFAIDIPLSYLFTRLNVIFGIDVSETAQLTRIIYYHHLNRMM